MTFFFWEILFEECISTFISTFSYNYYKFKKVARILFKVQNLVTFPNFPNKLQIILLLIQKGLVYQYFHYDYCRKFNKPFGIDEKNWNPNIDLLNFKKIEIKQTKYS